MLKKTSQLTNLDHAISISSSKFSGNDFVVNAKVVSFKNRLQTQYRFLYKMGIRLSRKSPMLQKSMDAHDDREWLIIRKRQNEEEED
jgi:hypothetical protein